MKFSRLSDAVLNRNSVWAVLLVLIIFLYSGCGGNDDGQILPNVTGADKVTSFGDLTKVTVKDMALTDKNADEYYARLEKILNGEYSSLSNAPKKAAGTPYLTNMVLSIRTDEVQALAAYDLATKITATANFSDGTTEVVAPAWMVYSGPATLVNNIYTAQAAAGQTVFIAYYTRDGVTRFVIFRLTVNNMSVLNLSMAADAVQASGNYDLSSITVYAKSSNGTSRDVTAAPNTKWSLLSGRGTLNGNIYTAPAMADTAIFLVQYTEAGVIESAQFTLKINGLTAVSLNKTTDEIQLPETYNLDSELIVTAKYSSGSTLEVTHAPGLTWTLTSGSGTLAGTVYTPTAKVETAVFTGSYTESGITKTTTFQLKAIGLSSLSLNKTTDEVQSCANYSLADNLILTDKLSNGTTTNRTMDPNTKWTLVSGRGALNGMVYTAPALAETAVIAATYIEAGISKTINFRLRVNALISLTLSKTTDETVISTPYDIASKLTVFAKFSSGQTKEVTTSPNLRWTISFGSGALNGAVYTTPERIETAVIVATYTENGVAQSVRFSLKVSATAPGTKVLLVGLTINKTTDSVQIFDKTYDLGNLAATGKYSNGTTREVTLSWIVTSGGGSVAGNIFTAPANVGTVQLMGSCTAEDGSVKSVYFTLKALNDTIDSVSALIGPEGGSLTLKNGVILQIPQGSVVASTNITLTQYNNIVNDNMNTYKIKSDKKITEGILAVSADQNAAKEFLTAALITPDGNLIYLNVDILNSKYVINLKDGFINNLSGTNQSPSITKAPNRYPEEYYEYLFFTEEYKKISNYYNPDINKFSGLANKLNCAYYNQYFGTCWATIFLSFIKTYNIKPGNDFNTIPKILHYYKIDKAEGRYLPFIAGKYNFVVYIHALAHTYNNLRKGFLGDEPVVDLNEEIHRRTNIKFEEKFFSNFYTFARYALICLSERKPILLDMTQHGIIITGYRSINNREIDLNNIDLNNLLFIYNNPSGYINEEGTITYISQRWNTKKPSELLTKVYTPLYDNNNDHQTIQLPDATFMSGNEGIIGFKSPTANPVDTFTWDHNALYGYTLVRSKESEIFDSNMDELFFYEVPIGNATNREDTIHVELTITGGDKNFHKWYDKKIYKNNTNVVSFGIPTSEFIGNAPNGEYNISVSILNKTYKWLDSFDINFVYKPLIINRTSKFEFIGKPVLFNAKVSNIDVTTNRTVWEVKNPDNNVETDANGVFTNGLLKTVGEITNPKKYSIFATYYDAVSMARKTAETEITILPGITPSKKAMCVGQSFQFKLGTEILESSSDYITWSATGGTINQDGYFTATNAGIGSPEICVTLKKGATIKSDKSDETLETNLITKPVALQILDLSIKPEKTFIDFNKTTTFQLTETNGGVYLRDAVEWSATSGNVDTSEVAGSVINSMKYKPSISGKSIITAKLKKGGIFHLGFDPLVEDVEKTMEVTAVKINVLEPMPLIARIEPIDALGHPMNNYRIEKEFSVSVDGATVPIVLPYPGSNKGIIELISTTDINTLPVIHKFKYTPPLNLESAPYCFGSDDTLHVDIKSTAFDTASTSAVIVVYKPVLKDITDKYPDGKISAVGTYVAYTTGEKIFCHGDYASYRDDNNHTPERSGKYEYGQNIGIHLYKESSGLLGGWYDYYDPQYLHAQATGYYFETTGIMPPVPRTRTVLFNLTRDSIDVPYTYTIISTRFTPGWEPPSDTLPPSQ